MADVELKAKPFYFGNPAVRQKGILHLYRINDGLSQTNTGRGDVLCMLSVPAEVVCTDLLNFISHFGKHIEHIRLLIRDSTPDEYMTLLKFKDRENAHKFYDMFNGKPFNTIEPEVCLLMYVGWIESCLLTVQGAESACLSLEGETELPCLTELPCITEFIPCETELPCCVCQQPMNKSVAGILTLLCNHSFHSSCFVNWPYSVCPNCQCDASLDSKCLTCDSKENLGMCMICGHIGCKRYDEGHALAHFRETNHIFVMELETKSVWDYAGDNYVYRLIQNDPDGKIVECCDLPTEVANDNEQEHSHLKNLKEELQDEKLMNDWLRNELQVMTDENSGWMLEMELTLLEITAELNRSRLEAQVTNRKCEKERKTLENKNLHCTTNLKNQEKELRDEKQMNAHLRNIQQIEQAKVAKLEKQLEKEKAQEKARKIEIAELEMSLSEAQTTSKKAQTTSEKAQTTSEKAQAERLKYERMFSDSEKERKGLEKKNTHCATKLKSLEKELQDEKLMNECLRNNQQIWQEKVAELEKQLKEMEAQRKTEVTELQEQVGDLMRHFEAQTAIEKAPADLQQELQEGQLCVTQHQRRNSKKKRKKNK